MKSYNLVSVIVTTKNEERNLETCLKSIKSQSYSPIEIIVVDNHSTDKTIEIAKKYTKKVLNKGPERSVQRNYGVKVSKGEYVLVLDADMKLSQSVVNDCVKKISKDKVGGIIIPEKSYGIGFWAEVKRLERSFYEGNDLIEAARFFSIDAFNEVGGFDENITGPEDWDLSQRVLESSGLTRIKSYIYHNEGKLSLMRSVYKKFYYSKEFSNYIQKSSNKKYAKKQFSIFNRYFLFLSQPVKLFSNPLLGFGVLIIKTAEFTAGGLGYIFGKIDFHYDR